MTESKVEYTTQRYAEPESQIADSAPDELTRLRAENIRLRNELDKQANAWGGYVDAHAGNYSRMNARIAELEKQLEWQVDVANAFMERHELAIKANMQQSETVARLEADNRRLRHLDAMPVDAMRLYDEAHATCRWIILHAAMDDYPRMQRVLSIAMRRRERRERALYRAILTGGDA